VFHNFIDETSNFFELQIDYCCCCCCWVGGFGFL